jgi:hypothetical protein
MIDLLKQHGVVAKGYSYGEQNVIIGQSIPPSFQEEL